MVMNKEKRKENQGAMGGGGGGSKILGGKCPPCTATPNLPLVKNNF